MKKILIPAAIVLAAVVVIVYSINSPKQDSSNPVNVSTKSAPTLSITPEKIDFGEIIQGDGVVSASVIVTNTSSETLQLHRLSTSCGCTTAEMDMSDLAPNEKRELTINFDPMVHPDQFGKIIRVVYLQTSSQDTPETEIDVVGNVIK